MKIYNNSAEFKRKIESALDKLCEYVLATYGPFGKNILIKDGGNTFLTKDGVTVAKSISSKDPTENAILDVLKEAADKTVKDAGDGTSASILFINEWIKIIQSILTAFSHVPSTEIYQTFMDFITKFNRDLENYGTDILNKKMLRDVAFMASNGDSLIADLVSDLIDAVGSAGMVSIQNSKSDKTSIKIMEGMKFLSSIPSNLLLDDLTDKIKLNDCVVLVSNTKVSYSDDLIRLLSSVIENKKSLLIVCPDIDEKSVLTIVTNVQRKAIQACIVSPSGLGNEKLEVLEDIALLCGTNVNPLQDINKTSWDQWGYCKTAEITKTMTTIIDGKATGHVVDAAVEALRLKLAEEPDGPAAKRLNARIARLTSTLGVVYVGGATDAEMIEKRHRIEDALESCHSAMRKGVVPGGGVALQQIANKYYETKHESHLKDYVQMRFIELLESPSKYLYGDKRFHHFEPPYNQKYPNVLNLRTNKFVDPIEDGLVESIWTIQAALMNSFSAAWVLSNSYGSIINEKEEKQNE